MIVHRDMVRSLLDLMLLLSVVAVVLTGLLLERLDLNEFSLHTLTGCAMTLLVTVHAVLHRRSLVGIVGHRPVEGERSPREHPASPVAVLPSAADADLHAGSDEKTGDGGGPHPVEPSRAGRARRSRRTVLTSFVVGAAASVAGWIARSEVAPSPYDGGDVGLLYHRESSLGVKGLLSSFLD